MANTENVEQLKNVAKVYNNTCTAQYSLVPYTRSLWPIQIELLFHNTPSTAFHRYSQIMYVHVSTFVDKNI